jgi:OmpA-OmpF porin, OOP family
MNDDRRRTIVLLAALSLGGAAHYSEAASPFPIPHEVSQAPSPKTHYVVFFDFMEANISTEATSILAAAVQTAKESGFRHASVIGHADRVGPSDVNIALSERRAESVKAELVKDGFGESGIATEGKGFSDPFVSTNPGVREPHNRRAVIVLSR